MSKGKPNTEGKIAEALKRQALKDVPPSKQDPKPLTKILRVAKDNGDTDE